MGFSLGPFIPRPPHFARQQPPNPIPPLLQPEPASPQRFTMLRQPPNPQPGEQSKRPIAAPGPRSAPRAAPTNPSGTAKSDTTPNPQKAQLPGAPSQPALQPPQSSGSPERNAKPQDHTDRHQGPTPECPRNRGRTRSASAPARQTSARSTGLALPSTASIRTSEFARSNRSVNRPSPSPSTSAFRQPRRLIQKGATASLQPRPEAGQLHPPINPRQPIKIWRRCF